MPNIKLKKFRKQLYHCLGKSKDAVFELTDAAILSRNPTREAELSLSPNTVRLTISNSHFDALDGISALSPKNSLE